MFAARFGRSGGVEILPWWKEVNPGKLRNASRMPLRFAVLGGHEDAVKTLLEREEVTPGGPNNGGQNSPPTGRFEWR